MGLSAYSEHMEAAITAANVASEVLMARFNAGIQNLQSWEKSPGALVTEADLESDQAIASALKDSGCGGEILSEESTVDLGDAGVDAERKIEWLIDPLCGTVPFSTGMNHWGVNIAMRSEGELVLSALAVPSSGSLLTAEMGDGVKLNGESLQITDRDRNLGDAVVGLEVDGQEVWRSLLDSGGLDWVTHVRQANSFSSAAYPLLLVATSRMAAVVFYRIEPMHVAAGSLAAMMLGAKVTDGLGQPIDWSCNDEIPILVAGWPRAHDTLIEAMNESG